jgi:uncharacterized protein with PIN domain
MGVPHTEVDLILVDGRSVDFFYRLGDGDRISVYPVFEALDISAASLVRPRPLRDTRFVADVHLGRLARYLRLLGFDTLYGNDWADDLLVETSVSDHRILLTRDRGLLKRKTLDHGYLVRHTDPLRQLAEVARRFDLRDSLRPLTRCPVCNVAVVPVAKEEAAPRLPLLTARYYDEFWRCEQCGRLYWKGGHHRSLEALVRSVLEGDGPG